MEWEWCTKPRDASASLKAGKFLPDAVARDPAALAASIAKPSSFVPNRPNNCTAYDVGEEYERTFLAVEFEELGS